MKKGLRYRFDLKLNYIRLVVFLDSYLTVCSHRCNSRTDLPLARSNGGLWGRTLYKTPAKKLRLYKYFEVRISYKLSAAFGPKTPVSAPSNPPQGV